MVTVIYTHDRDEYGDEIPFDDNKALERVVNDALGEITGTHNFIFFEGAVLVTTPRNDSYIIVDTCTTERILKHLGVHYYNRVVVEEDDGSIIIRCDGCIQYRLEPVHISLRHRWRHLLRPDVVERWAQKHEEFHRNNTDLVDHYYEHSGAACYFNYGDADEVRYDMKCNTGREDWHLVYITHTSGEVITVHHDHPAWRVGIERIIP
jgi:hypothetical protein